MDLLKPKEVAKLLGISYPTLKQWIYQNKIRSVKTLGGHHRIPVGEVERITGASVSAVPENSHMIKMEAISLRNKMPGIIADIYFEGLFAQIKIDVGGREVMALIPRQACQDLDLKKGEAITFLFKAIDVMVIRS